MTEHSIDTVEVEEARGAGALRASGEGQRIDVLCDAEADWAELESRHTGWYDSMQHTPPWAMARSELLALAEAAPTAFARGFVVAWLMARQDVANQTSVPFL